MDTRRSGQPDQPVRSDWPEESEGLSRREEEPQIAETGLGIEPWPQDAEPGNAGDKATDEAPNPSPS